MPFAAIHRHARFDLLHGTLERVRADEHVAVVAGEDVPYDKLLVAVGARRRPVIDGGAITFGGPADVAAVSAALEGASQLAFVLPAATIWPLPVYELAMLAAADLRDRGMAPEITVVTAETEPLWLFGPEASVAVRELLAERGIALRAGSRAVGARPGELMLADGPPVAADRVIALPELIGPTIPGLPQGPSYFIPTDTHGRVDGVPDVFAAGDATAFPLKQGGLATQQADAAAEQIAADLGAAVTPKPFRPVLRGLLLTGGAPLYLRSALTAAGTPTRTDVRRTPRAVVSQRALWWPPAKIAGRYLAPLLATARPPLLSAAQMQDLRPGAADDDGDDARELALLMAQEDAAVGDYAQALRSLDAATMLAGGVLPAEWADRRRHWEAAHSPG